MRNEPKDWGAIRAKIMQRHTEVGECWEWKSFFTKGRPVVHYETVEGKHTCAPARRLVAILWGKQVRATDRCVPTCDNPACINPDHIKVMAQREHLRRAARLSNAGNDLVRSAKIAATSRANRAKLTWDQVKAIRSSDQSYRRLSAEYGVSKTVIGRIKRNEVWIDHVATSNPFAGLMR